MNPETLLTDLPATILDSQDNQLGRAVIAAGHSGTTPRQAITAWNVWHLSVGEFLDGLGIKAGVVGEVKKLTAELEL